MNNPAKWNNPVGLQGRRALNKAGAVDCFHYSHSAHGGAMLSGIMLLATAVIAAYVFISFISAIRMLLAYGVYAHIEYKPAKWRKFGHWSPRRLILLVRLRRLAVLAIVVLLVCTIVPPFLGGSSSSMTVGAK
jgi:hypothetical protein